MSVISLFYFIICKELAQLQIDQFENLLYIFFLAAKQCPISSFIDSVVFGEETFWKNSENQYLKITLMFAIFTYLSATN